MITIDFLVRDRSINNLDAHNKMSVLTHGIYQYFPGDCRWHSVFLTFLLLFCSRLPQVSSRLPWWQWRRRGCPSPTAPLSAGGRPQRLCALHEGHPGAEDLGHAAAGRRVVNVYCQVASVKWSRRYDKTCYVTEIWEGLEKMG